MKLTPTTSPPSCSTSPPIASTVPPVASTSSWISDARAVRDRVGVELERVLRRTRARRSRSPSPAAAFPAAGPDEPAPHLVAIAAAEREAARLRAEHEVRLAALASIRRGPRSPARAPRGHASSGEMSLNPTPGSGQSGTSRMRDLRSIAAISARRTLSDRARRAAQQRAPAPPRRASRRSRRPCAAPLGVPPPQRRRDERAEQARLSVGRGAERAQVPRADPVTGSRPHAAAMSASVSV